MSAFKSNELGQTIEITFDNKEFQFAKIGGTKVELAQVFSKHRRAGRIEGEYTAVSDIPEEVITCVGNEGYNVIGVQ